MGMVRSRVSSSRTSSRRSTSVLVRRLKKPLGAAVSFYVCDRTGNGNFRGAFHDIKRGGPEFAFATDQFTFAVTPFNDGAAIEFQECAGHALEYGDAKKFFGLKCISVLGGGDGGTGDAFVGERAGGTRNHTFAAGDARGIAHGRIQIEGDTGGISFAHAPEHKIVFNFVAAANAAIAKDARVMINGDGQRRIVEAARDSTFGETRLLYARGFCERFQFAIA